MPATTSKIMMSQTRRFTPREGAVFSALVVMSGSVEVSHHELVVPGSGWRGGGLSAIALALLLFAPAGSPISLPSRWPESEGRVSPHLRQNRWPLVVASPHCGQCRLI